MFFFLVKKIVFRGRQKMPKCPPFWHYKQLKHVKSFFHEKFWEVTERSTACGRDDLLLVFT